MDCFKILNIEPTKDIKIIKRAYADMIKKHHPEDDPEGYNNIRNAYKEALALCKDKSSTYHGKFNGYSNVNNYNEQSDEFNFSNIDNAAASKMISHEIMSNILQIYKDFNRRFDINSWKCIFDNYKYKEAILSNDFKILFLEFLEQNNNMPKYIFEYLDSVINFNNVYFNGLDNKFNLNEALNIVNSRINLKDILDGQYLNDLFLNYSYSQAEHYMHLRFKYETLINYSNEDYKKIKKCFTNLCEIYSGDADLYAHFANYFYEYMTKNNPLRISQGKRYIDKALKISNNKDFEVVLQKYITIINETNNKKGNTKKTHKSLFYNRMIYVIKLIITLIFIMFILFLFLRNNVLSCYKDLVVVQEGENYDKNYYGGTEKNYNSKEQAIKTLENSNLKSKEDIHEVLDSLFDKNCLKDKFQEDYMLVKGSSKDFVNKYKDVKGTIDENIQIEKVKGYFYKKTIPSGSFDENYLEYFKMTTANYIAQKSYIAGYLDFKEATDYSCRTINNMRALFKDHGDFSDFKEQYEISNIYYYYFLNHKIGEKDINLKFDSEYLNNDKDKKESELSGNDVDNSFISEDFQKYCSSSMLIKYIFGFIFIIIIDLLYPKIKRIFIRYKKFKKILSNEDQTSNLGKWSRALSSVLIKCNNGDPYIFGGYEKTAEMTAFEKNQLENWWSIYSREDLIEEINYLLSDGQRKEFKISASKIESLTYMEFRNMINNLNKADKIHYKVTRYNLDKWKDKALLAWDLCRISNLAQLGYIANYLTLQEAQAIVEPAIIKIKQSFSSWDDVQLNYLDGYLWWANEERDYSKEYAYRFQVFKQLKSSKILKNSLYNDKLFQEDIIPLKTISYRDILKI